jgi:hypothetical protein
MLLHVRMVASCCCRLATWLLMDCIGLEWIAWLEIWDWIDRKSKPASYSVGQSVGRSVSQPPECLLLASYSMKSFPFFAR